jgi:hypothetical protein
MFRLAKRIVVTSMVVLPAIIGLSVVSAGAATMHSVVPMHGLAHPNVNLVGSGSSVRFDPSKLSVTNSKNGNCTPAHGQWTITNKTSAVQVILLKREKLFSLGPGAKAAICQGGSPGTYVHTFTLKSSPHAVLKVKITIP